MISQVFDQARLKEKLAFARSFVTQNRKELTNKRILGSLRKLGVATRSELKELESRIAKLESKLEALQK